MYKFLKVIVSFLIKIIYRVDVKGIENFPKNGPLIISANHTHIFDPVIIAILTKSQIIFVSKKELFEKKLASKFFTKLGVIPIDRENTDFKAIKSCFKALRNNEMLGIFPEGTRVKNVDIRNMKKGVALIALKSNTPILPIHIESNYKMFSKVKVNVYSKIETDIYENMEESEAIDKLTEKLFYEIYQNKDENLHCK
ncbi:MAG: lysophospholipid acyltransferase family protein [Parvimonas sp.]|uniref:lysophospholipid acyltransferase family protein n=1 Tax=Parvimonas sp. TaxID=1944660 RepID=UPI0025ED2D41|nr:lysophospholipid acyltransferase family protein [Parvimonas sp.]MCI5996857.1 1-acyl-sn-glycerol-3-phosphate acyltransferase [Parvimonas sp.]MDY3050502.1 lysophospholipid acyltransferase family protein [Parvimonas sp.]